MGDYEQEETREVNRRRFQKYVGSAAVVVGAPASSLNYFLWLQPSSSSTANIVTTFPGSLRLPWKSCSRREGTYYALVSILIFWWQGFALN